MAAQAAPADSDLLLDVRRLSLSFDTPAGQVPVLDEVTLQVRAGETVCLVGESGCGKSVLARASLGLLPTPPARVEAELLTVAGEPLQGRRERELAAIRGRKVGFVFQEPGVALNPVVRVGVQLVETARRHLPLSRKEAFRRAEELLRAVGIPDPRLRLRAYPHQLSGGMRQRVMLAVALASEPQLLIADEPTTALDVTIQAQILRLLDGLRRQRELGLLLITHDLGVVAEVADRVVVLYAGQVVEEADVHQLFAEPAHPYSAALLRSLPGVHGSPGSGCRLPQIPGQVPQAGRWPPGCRFAPRCPQAAPRCSAGPVPLLELPGGRRSRCLLGEDHGA